MKTRPLVLIILGVYIFSPALFTWIVNPNGAWYRPYVIWLIVIIAAYFIHSRRKKDSI